MKTLVIKITAVVSVFALLTMFNNCGRIGFDANRWAAWDSASLGSAVCESDLKNTYSTTYFPYLSTSCWSCHSTGHGSTDINTSFASFKSKGANLIDSRAADSHNGLPGAEQTNKIGAFKATYTAAQDRYASCLASAPAPGGGNTLRLLPKVVPNIEATRTNRNLWQTINWDMEQEVTTADKGRFTMAFKIEARYAMNGTVVQGVEFRNPSMRLKAAGTAVSVSGLDVYVNGALASDVTTYSGVNVSVSTTTDTALAPGAGVAFAYNTAFAANTEVAFQVANIQSGTGGTTGGTTGATTAGTTGSTIPATVSFTQLTSTDATLNVFRTSCYSCHSGGNVLGGFNISTYATAQAQASAIRSRMNNSGNPMPPSGILPARQRDLVDVWVNTGAPQ